MLRSVVRLALPCTPLLAFVACRQVLGIDDRDLLPDEGGGGHSAAVPLPTAEQIQAARGIAVKDCSGWEKCVPVTFAEHFVDQADCVEKDAVFWAAHFFGEDSGATIESVQGCGADLDLSTCDAWWLLNLGAGPGACDRTGSPLCEAERLSTLGDGPASCFPKGARQPGDACGAGAQCDSGLCWFTQDPRDPCGICQNAAAGEGDACPDGTSCSGPFTCFDQRCVALGGTYSPCGACLPHLVCFLGQCKPRLEDGESCDPTETVGNSKCQIAHACNVVTALCESPEPQALGEACGALDDGRIGDCEQAAACGLGPGADEARCVARIPLGEPCGTGYLFGEGCAYPGDCVAGVCQLRGPATCE